MTHHSDDDELAELRRASERAAYSHGLAMLDNPDTPATARASVVRAFLTAAAARQGDDSPFEPHSATPEQLAREMELLMRRLSTKRPNVIDVTPAPRPSDGIFE